MNLVNKPKKEAALCHELVMKIAKEMAGVHHETVCGLVPDFYKAFPKQDAYVDGHWNEFVGQARGVLADMLKGDAFEAQHELIYDALMLDRTLPGSQSRGVN